MTFKRTVLILPLLIIIFSTAALAQYNHDIASEMEIDEILYMESSPAHLYILSDTEGLVVFRTYDESLQYLYSSTGMQQRGNKLHADIRFAYLYGDSRRLTVIEPTSVLGVYSSTVLPERPVTTRRIGNNLYILMSNGTLGTISLETPESVDSDPEEVDTDRLGDREVNDLATDANRILYVLSDSRIIDIYSFSSSEQQLVHEESVELDRSIEKIFYTENELIGSTSDGEIYLIDSNGSTQYQNSVQDSLEKLAFWNDEIVVRTEGGSLWIGELGNSLTHWKENERAGNHFAVNKGRLYVTEFSSMFPVIRMTEDEEYAAGSDDDRAGRFSIKQIETVTVPFPKPLILPLEVQGFDGNVSSISFSVESSLSNIRVRGNSLYWQPGANNTGRHQIAVTATTPDGRSTQMEFTADVRPFNSPPRFSPSRPQTIPAEEAFEFKISAFDPDGTHPDLIRYLGVDLPSGASLNEQTGILTWEPNIRQVGSHKFRVIATDQFGAAASQEFELRVVEVTEGEEVELENVIDS